MDAGVTSRPFVAVVQLVQEVAATPGDASARLGAAVEVLTRAVGAKVGILASGGREEVDLHPVAGAGPHPDRDRAHSRHVTTEKQPLIDRVRAGGMDVTTSERLVGPPAWAASGWRARLVRRWGVDHLASVPLRPGPEPVLVLLGREGDDFDDAALRLLSGLQPVVGALASILDLAALPAPATQIVRLTERERTILELLSQGLTASRIARLAGCSPRTVHHHLSSIYTKLDVGDRLSAVNRARELGLVEREALLVH